MLFKLSELFILSEFLEVTLFFLKKKKKIFMYIFFVVEVFFYLFDSLFSAAA